MEKIKHCGNGRRTKAYSLRPKDPTKHSREILLICPRCPDCGLKVIELIKVDNKGRRSPPDRIPHNQHQEVEARIKTDEIKPQHQPYSDYTLLIGQDPANVFKQVLERCVPSLNAEATADLQAYPLQDSQAAYPAVRQQQEDISTTRLQLQLAEETQGLSCRAPSLR